MGLLLKNKEIAVLDNLIDFFATLYDLFFDFINFLIAFFAFQYDVVYNFVLFLWECAKWATNMDSAKSTDYTIQAEEPIQVQHQNTFEVR